MFPNLLKHCELCSMNLKCYAEYTKNMIKEVLSLENILNESHIRIREEARDWEGAIRRAGEVLVQAGSIKPGYIDKMIRSVKELGPYIVIMPGFALAHAAPCEDVIKSDIALITLKNPVCFESPNDPVSVVQFPSGYAVGHCRTFDGRRTYPGNCKSGQYKRSD